MRQLNNIPELTKDKIVTKNNFWINDIGLFIPPTNISIHKEGLNYSIKSLRTKSSVKMSSGNGIYHLQINLVFPPESLLQLHRLICQIKNNPFVFIENDFIKNSIDNNNLDRTIYIYATLMGLNVSNHPSSPGSFLVELDLRHFNERVYSENLGYKRDDLYSFIIGDKVLGVSFDIFDADIINVVKEETKKPEEKTIRYIERSLEKEISSKSLGTVKVGRPKDSLVYRRYSNYLQILYLKKYFNIEVKRQRDDTESGFIVSEDSATVYLNKPISEALNKGEIGLHDIFHSYENEKYKSNLPDIYLTYMRQRLIHAMYLTSKHTRVFYRNFATLNITSFEQKELRKIINKGIKSGMTSEQKYKHKIKNLEEISKKMNNSSKEKYEAKENLDKPVSFSSLNFRRFKNELTINGLSKNFVEPLKEEIEEIESSKFCNFFEKGKYKIIADESSTMIIIECTNESDFFATILPCDCTVEMKERKDGFFNVTLSSVDSENSSSYEEFFIERISVPPIVESHYYNNLMTVYPKGSLIGFSDSNVVFNFKCSGNFFEKLPMAKSYIESRIKLSKEYNEKIDLFKKIEKKFKFINSSYQKYLGRKEVEDVYVKENTIEILDYTDYEINLISNMSEGFKDNDFTHGDNTVIANLSGSLRHIVASIPILGMESPTHQFLGSIEPTYQFNLIGKKGPRSMPLTFIELEKVRHDSQKFAKSFSIVPGASFIGIESMITKLLGSYEKSYRSINEIGSDSYKFIQIQEKYNFSINSLDTFTLDGQPNAMGMNFRVDETRDYNEEEIRPAFSNEVSNQKLNDLYKELIEGISSSNKSNSKILSNNQSLYKKINTNENSYNVSKWGEWVTKHYSADDYYNKIRLWNNISKEKYTPSTLDEYMEIFEKHKEEEWLHPDESAYYICLVLSQMQDYFNEIFKTKNKMKIFSAIRYETRPNMRIVKTIATDKRKIIPYKDINFNNEEDIKSYRSMHYSGGAVDLYYSNQNATEVLIYMYFLQLFNFIDDPVPGTNRSKTFLGMGIYGLDSYLKTVKMSNKLGRSGFIHLDLNYKIEEKSITNDLSIYKEQYFKNEIRTWYGINDVDKYSDELKIWNILEHYKDSKNIEILKEHNDELTSKGFENLEYYIDKVLTAHKNLTENENVSSLKKIFEDLAERLN